MSHPNQKLLYLCSKSSHPRSPIISWELYDPDEPHQPTLPSQEPLYNSVLDALADGWRILQLPIPQLYSFSELDNDYLSFEFVLER